MKKWDRIIREETTQTDVINELGNPDDITEKVTLVNTSGLILLSYSNPLVSFFIGNDKVFFIVLVPDESEDYPNTVNDWKNLFKHSSTVLSSSRGKNYHVYINPEEGKAGIFDANNEIFLIEFFKPMDLDNYMKLFYKKPNKFIK